MIFYVIVMCCLNFSLNMYLDNFFVVMISLLNPKHLLIKRFEKKKKNKNLSKFFKFDLFKTQKLICIFINYRSDCFTPQN